MPTTIGRSFTAIPTNALPHYPNPSTTASASITDESTNTTEAPKFAVPVLSNFWVALGMTFITPIANLLNNEYIPLREEAVYHATEADIARSANLYLIHPINQALCTNPDLAGTIKCQSEHVPGQPHSDLAYYRTPASAGGAHRAFAVVQFKGRGVIKRHEFQEAERVITGNTPAAAHVQAALAFGGESSSFFDGDAYILIKEAAAYATRHRTRYVALFNWDVLLLVKFVDMNHRLQYKELMSQGVGDWCETTVVPFATESHAMRAALLGFLAEAYQNTPP